MRGSRRVTSSGGPWPGTGPAAPHAPEPAPPAVSPPRVRGWGGMAVRRPPLPSASRGCRGATALAWAAACTLARVCPRLSPRARCPSVCPRLLRVCQSVSHSPRRVCLSLSACGSPLSREAPTQVPEGCHRAMTIVPDAGSPGHQAGAPALASAAPLGGEGRLRGTPRGDTGVRRGDAGGWDCVKSGCIFPILPVHMRHDIPDVPEGTGAGLRSGVLWQGRKVVSEPFDFGLYDGDKFGLGRHGCSLRALPPRRDVEHSIR